MILNLKIFILLSLPFFQAIQEHRYHPLVLLIPRSGINKECYHYTSNFNQC